MLRGHNIANKGVFQKCWSSKTVNVDLCGYPPNGDWKTHKVSEEWKGHNVFVVPNEITSGFQNRGSKTEGVPHAAN